MNIDRLAFLALATSLAAVACSSADVEAEDGDEGALAGGGECRAAGGDAPISTTALRACGDLAKRGEAVGEHAPSLTSVCGGYLTNFKTNAAEQARACLDAIRPVGSGLGTMLDWEAVYGCGYQALTSSCVSPEAERECDALIPGLKPEQRITHEGKSDAASVRAECVSFMSGLKPSGRTNVKTCVKGTADWAPPFYSCVEGIDPNGRATCIDGNARPRTADGKALTRQENAYQCYHLPGPDAEGLCLQFTAAARVGIGAEIAQRMRMTPIHSEVLGSRSYHESLYDAGIATLRSTCGNAAVNDSCKELVAKYTAAGVSNAGGRITRECRSLFPGLLKEGRARVLATPVPADGKIATALVKLPVVQASELPAVETTTE